METTNFGLVAGSHHNNEFIVFRQDGQFASRQFEVLCGQVCQICGDEIGANEDGELFVACNECAFPVCRNCYDYERREGSQVCPQCKTRYKRLKGCARVEGDEDEDDIDDLDNEFGFDGRKNTKQDTQLCVSEVDIPHENHVLVPSTMSVEVAVLQARPMDPSKDLAAYGYGSVAWKERVEIWKQKQERLREMRNEKLSEDQDNDVDDKELPLYEKEGKPSELSPIDIFVTTVDPMKESPLVIANTVLSVLAVDYPAEKVSCYVSDDGAAMLTFETLSETSEFARKWVPFCKKFNIEPRAPEWYFAEKINYLKDKAHPRFVKERRAMKREYEEFRVRINSLVAKARKVPEEGWTMQDGTPWPGNNVRDHPGMIQIFLGQNGAHDLDGNELPCLVYVSREKKHNFKHHKKAGALNALARVSAVLTNAPYLLNLDYDHYINNSKAIREAMCFMMDPLLAKRVCYVQFSHKFDGIESNDQYDNQNTAFFDINMKGLDGIQGPLYVGTGSVFRRQALYGYDAPKKKKQPTKTCNCWPKWCCCGCCYFGKKKKKKLKKPKHDVKEISLKKVESSESDALKGIEQVSKVQSRTLPSMPEWKLEKKFGQSPVLIASTLLENGNTLKDADPASLLKEAIHVISCGYEERTEWGKEVGWIYGSTTEDILTGFKMHCHGWRSIYCIPERPAFKVSAPISLSDSLHQVLRWALGSIEIFMSKHCPVWYGYGGGLKWLERISYINAIVYPWTSIPMVIYCTIPAFCLLTGKFIIPELTSGAGMWFLSVFICIFATSVLEMRWSGVTIDEWWRNQQFWVIGGVSAHIFALFVGIIKVIAGINANFIVKSKKDHDKEFAEIFTLKWTTLLILPTTLLILNLVAIVAGVSYAINNGFDSWGPHLGKLFFSFCVIAHLYPFLKGILGRHNRTPTIILVWSILLASIFSVLWVKLHPLLPKSKGPYLEECGLDCN
ncbi:hypothetical protein L6164_023351 [Bauhinia variegata]|uniref:Uncharacterized protein n=1 Tax=Bauhinia variegata TaxID=167791 RepID=A0ACB9MHZ4_BAUVA|nr:hypothetical protein L6164_023351 [Bauhinia variegata]